MATKSGNDRTGLSEKMQDTLDASSNKSKVGHAGASNVEPIVVFDPSQREKIITHDDSHIVLGGDRISSKASGYAGKGHTGAHMIDLVVGRDPKLSGNPSFKGDAARIYISQRTDIDLPLGLAQGEVGSNKARSAIGMKADGIRIVAREGIKLVTMGKGTELSTGSKLKTYTGIDLIAGNDDSDLEAIVKSEKLADTLKEVLKAIDKACKAMNKIISNQSAFNREVVGILPLSNGQRASMIANAMKMQLDSLKEVQAARMYGAKVQLRHPEPFASGWFGSRNNYTN
jgi:hypothetical protein